MIKNGGGGGSDKERRWGEAVIRNGGGSVSSVTRVVRLMIAIAAPISNI